MSKDKKPSKKGGKTGDGARSQTQTFNQTIENLTNLLQTVKAETNPMNGHPDPKAITDCWDEIFLNIGQLVVDNATENATETKEFPTDRVVYSDIYFQNGQSLGVDVNNVLFIIRKSSNGIEISKVSQAGNQVIIEPIASNLIEIR